MTGRSIVELHDGRRIDITGLAPDAVFDLLSTLGVTLTDIRRTVHYLAERIPPRSEAPAP